MCLKFSVSSVLCLIAFACSGGVRTVGFNPPLSIAAGEMAGSDTGFGALGVDFNLDGRADLRLVYGNGGITAFFNSTNRLVIKGSVAAISFGTVISSNLPPDLSAYRWDGGRAVPTNSELRQFGQRKQMVLTTLTAPQLPGLPMQVAGGGTPITQPVLASGDVVGKEGVIAVEFDINGQAHYGYIAVDFRSTLGTGGKILGWAWETEPGVAITAIRIGSSQ